MLSDKGIRDWGIAGIYKITNTINGKSYMGKSAHIMQRWTTHKSRGSAKKSKLSYDIQKFGLDKFVLQILRVFKTKEEYYKESFFYEKHFMSVFEPEYNIAFCVNQGNTKGLSLDDDDYCIKARTYWERDLKRFREKFNTLEKYNEHYHPFCTTKFMEKQGFV